MSKRLAMIENNRVVNIAEFPNDWSGDLWGHSLAVEVPEGVTIGYIYDGSVFKAPKTDPAIEEKLTIIRNRRSEMKNLRSRPNRTPAEDRKYIQLLEEEVSSFLQL